MAGPGEQSADTSLDDILSSIRRLVSDDLNGADQLRQKMDAALTQHPQTSEFQHATAAPARDTVPQVQAVPADRRADPAPAAHIDNLESTAALIAAARAAAGTPARDYVAAEPRISQAEVSRPRESLAPFDRNSAPNAEAATAFSEPVADLQKAAPALDNRIVLPTEMEIDDQAAAQFRSDEQHNGHNGFNAATALDPVNSAPEQPKASVAQEPVPTAQADVNGTVGLNGPTQMNGAALPCAHPETEEQQPFDLGPLAEEPHAGGDLAEGTIAVELNGASQENDGINGHHVHEPAKEAVSHAQPAQQSTAPAQVSAGLSSSVIEQTVTRMLRPMLKEWLDENMPRLIEQALREDVSNEAGSN